MDLSILAVYLNTLRRVIMLDRILYCFDDASERGKIVLFVGAVLGMGVLFVGGVAFMIWAH
jgi:hypothetical protein